MALIPPIGQVVERPFGHEGRFLDWLRQIRIDHGPDEYEQGVLWWGFSKTRFQKDDVWWEPGAKEEGQSSPIPRP